MSATMTATEEKPLNVYRLNSGLHEDTKPGWRRPVGPDGKPQFFNEHGMAIIEESHLYVARDPNNNIVRTHKDLIKSHGAEKFTLLSGDPALIGEAQANANNELLRDNAALRAKIKELEERNNVAPERLSTDPGLTGLTVAQLKERAEDLGVDVSGCRTKDQLVSAIVAHEQASAGE